MRDASSEQVTGVLAPFAEGFSGYLHRLGYAPQSRSGHLRLMSQFSDWLATRGSDSAGVSDQLAGEFVRERRAGGCREGRSVRALAPLLEHLRQAGAIPPAVVDPVVGPVEVLLAEYARYAASERGLSSQTIERSAALLRPFLAEHVTGDGDRLALGSLTSAEVSGFMLACSQRVSPATVQRTATALRSLLGFLHLRGVLDSSLVGAVPATARWKLARLPEYLSGEQVEALLASCDLVTPVGRRDRAILAVLARLGLRAGEVAALGLDDIDWRRGEIALRGKGNRHDRLPLPVDVGEALVAYLTEARPAAADTRAVFIGARAPHRALTRGAVTQVVARASARAGLGTVYAHRLRHTAASSMLAAGGSLTEIGQVLRHQRAITTAGYAKVDHHRLRVLARPWPGDAA